MMFAPEAPAFRIVLPTLTIVLPPEPLSWLRMSPPELSLKVLDESATVATACGHKPSEPLLSRHAAAMTVPGSQLTSSMYRDLRKGAPVEADHILGDFIERGSAHGVATPLLKAAFVNLRVYQEGLSKR